MPALLYLAPNLPTILDHIQAGRNSHEAVRPGGPKLALQLRYFLQPTAEAARWLSSGWGNSLGVHFFQFYGLAQTILAQAGRPVPQVSDTAAHRLVRHVLDEMHVCGELTTFAPVQEKPGFIQMLQDWLREMKTQGITLEQVSASAAAGGQIRDRQLALFYHRYQTFLQRAGMADADGLLWLANEALAANPHILQDRLERPTPFLVLGFDQFNPVQVSILQNLTARLSRLAVYLLWDPLRAPESLVLTRLRQTRAELERALTAESHVLPDTDTGRPPHLHHLRRTLFETGAEMVSIDQLDQKSGIASIQAVAAPSREAEVRRALRAMKQLLLDRGSTGADTPPGAPACHLPAHCGHGGRRVRGSCTEYTTPGAEPGRRCAHQPITSGAGLPLAPDLRCPTLPLYSPNLAQRAGVGPARSAYAPAPRRGREEAMALCLATTGELTGRNGG
ncbi:MAG: hypothetical protein EXR62_12355 [Chloroflexi bacterium]|nr:hypothetical protein [Chloroflexota bacterium]